MPETNDKKDIYDSPRNVSSLVVYDKPGVATQLTMGQIRDIGKIMATSALFSDLAGSESKAIIKMLAGQELGIPPLLAMTKIHIITTKHGTALQVGSEIMATKIKQTSGEYDYRVIEHTATKCVIDFFHKGDAIYHSVYTIEDAQRAGLIREDGNWKRNPKAQLYARAMSQGARIACPHVIGGLYNEGDDFDIGTKVHADEITPPEELPAPEEVLPEVEEVEDGNFAEIPEEMPAGENRAIQPVTPLPEAFQDMDDMGDLEPPEEITIPAKVEPPPQKSHQPENKAPNSRAKGRAAVQSPATSPKTVPMHGLEADPDAHALFDNDPKDKERANWPAGKPRMLALHEFGEYASLLCYGTKGIDLNNVWEYIEKQYGYPDFNAFKEDSAKHGFPGTTIGLLDFISAKSKIMGGKEWWKLGQ